MGMNGNKWEWMDGVTRNVTMQALGNSSKPDLLMLSSFVHGLQSRREGQEQFWDIGEKGGSSVSGNLGLGHWIHQVEHRQGEPRSHLKGYFCLWPGCFQLTCKPAMPLCCHQASLTWFCLNQGVLGSMLHHWASLPGPWWDVYMLLNRKNRPVSSTTNHQSTSLNIFYLSYFCHSSIFLGRIALLSPARVKTKGFQWPLWGCNKRVLWVLLALCIQG